MRGELIYLVETERRGIAAVSKLVCMMLGIGAFVVGEQWAPGGTACLVALFAVLARALAKDRAYKKLLDERNEIASVERVTTLGRPALRIRFLRGGRVTLPTWNVDRERVYATLQTRELPPARLLR